MTEEDSTSSDTSKQNSESDINIDDTQDEQNSQTPETLQIHNVYNTTMHDKEDSIHDEYDTSEDKNITEIETYEHYGRISMKLNNENEIYTLHFMFSYKYSTYQLIRRQET